MDDEQTWGLRMPFVVVTSKGGPYDDNAFTAGYECGSIDQLLASPDIVDHTAMVHSGSVPQLDLIAMDRGFTMEKEPWEEHPDEWTKAVFRRVPSTDGGMADTQG